ncbi:AAA family ATPase [Alkalibacter rhizosphaerae]|uniref:AAA family ATPase n=1 Tax=Alkalibacter rhizosphaerae TaxID=2815577 RepID=A0A975AIS6_9FIRM|nr:MoxR family ATPase [Alkalibacter rhizosphaerae]QSX09413.1 AAA family ATPase [Alkalibacter rhizosphaerae]
MNIQQAKDQIKHAIQIYLKKDEFGGYKIPLVRQRPIFMLGAPGIGKTAIMEQIAQELGVALVSYSMTHHTRQSALGLPYIEHKQYGGKDHVVSEYTMSEIIASVYDTMEESGKEEGILFLDEINCVSETLAPAMLQFLQYKVFGRHQVPDGWVVVTAGNPPEYNRSVREFDVVTMDRLKILEVEEDYGVWKNYASTKGIHGSILSYLDIKKDDFYVMETTVDGKSFVTARGWEDLSEAIRLYEEEELDVDLVVVGQYLRHDKTARGFSAYYQLYNKYKEDYRIQEILEGKASSDVRQKAREADGDERISLLSLLLESIQESIRYHQWTEHFLRDYIQVMKQVKIDCDLAKKDVDDLLESHIRQQRLAMEGEEKANSLSEQGRHGYQRILRALREVRRTCRKEEITRHQEAFSTMREDFDAMVGQMKAGAKTISDQLHHLFQFAEDVFGDGREVRMLVAELTANYYSAKFIATQGSADYYRHNKKLMFHEKQANILKEIDELEI